MNRPGGVQQSLRGVPAGYGGQQQPQQSGRAVVSNRFPNGKIGIAGSNGASWAFGGMPMTGGSLSNAARQIGGNASFAQSLGGSSQPATSLDLSEFPSLSNNSQMANANSSSMWSAQIRNLSGPAQRNHVTPLGSQAGQQDDLFSQSVRMNAQNSLRFSNQIAGGPSSLPHVNPTEDFPPLGRNGNGEIGQERGSNLMSALGFGSQSSASATAMQNNRAGNGLLNALNANVRTAETRSPTAGPRATDTRSPVVDDGSRRGSMGFRESNLPLQSSVIGDASISQQPDNRNPLGAIGAIGKDQASNKAKEGKSRTIEYQDPLEGMPPSDKYGLKGLSTLMRTYEDFNALTVGLEPTRLGLDLGARDNISEQIYSLFEDTPPRPTIPNFTLPECYMVKNVQPIETKISTFNEETLMWIFYSNPGDVKQHWAAQELVHRNWRWHKKLRVWLTKDEMMVPRVLGAGREEGYYITWDTKHWRKERREFTLHYTDLDATAGLPVPGIGL